MVPDREMLSFVANRVQMLYKTVSESTLGLTDVEEGTLGAADAVDHNDTCAGESLSDVNGFLGALNGGEAGGGGAEVESERSRMEREVSEMVQVNLRLGWKVL
eukprot:g19479.t1